MHFCFFIKKVCCVKRRFCREELLYIFFALLSCAWLAAAGCRSRFVCQREDGSTGEINVSDAVTVSAQPVKRIKEGGGSAAADVKKNRQELLMMIYDENGVKRLLSSKHPACLTEGLYFVFSEEMRDCQMRTNGGEWVGAGRRVYVLPPEAAGDILCVQFRTRMRDGGILYSRKFVLMKKIFSECSEKFREN